MPNKVTKLNCCGDAKQVDQPLQLPLFNCFLSWSMWPKKRTYGLKRIILFDLMSAKLSQCCCGAWYHFTAPLDLEAPIDYVLQRPEVEWHGHDVHLFEWIDVRDCVGFSWSRAESSRARQELRFGARIIVRVPILATRWRKCCCAELVEPFMSRWSMGPPHVPTHGKMTFLHEILAERAWCAFALSDERMTRVHFLLCPIRWKDDSFEYTDGDSNNSFEYTGSGSKNCNN